MAEFVILMAMMVSILALSTDVMLPALDVIGQELQVRDPNDAQLVVSALFLGFAFGQVLSGPISDSIGRKPVVYGGYALFILGCLLSMLAESFDVMLAGRVLQGLGAAGPRIVTLAMVRDMYEGRAMARIMSFIMAVFIIAPAVAPALGQVVILLAGWRATFALLFVLAAVALVWCGVRQPETHPPHKRRPFTPRSFVYGVMEACRYRAAVGYTIAAGLIFGAFVGYLSAAQQIFQVSYRTGLLFPLYFGTAALAIGAASLVNSRLVMRLGMRHLTWRALAGATVLALCFLPVVIAAEGLPPLWLFMAWQLPTFFCMGIMFGNFNALAMEPLGHVAGLGAALVGSGTAFISLPFGWASGHGFDGGVTALVAGYASLGIAALGVMWWTERG